MSTFNLLLEGPPGFKQLAAAGGGADAQQGGYLVMVVAFDHVKVENYAIAVRQVADKPHKFPGAQCFDDVGIRRAECLHLPIDIGEPNEPFSQDFESANFSARSRRLSAKDLKLAAGLPKRAHVQSGQRPRSP